MRKVCVALALVLLVGCGQPRPTLSGGKPVSHWVEVLQSNPDARARKEAAFKLGNAGPLDPTVFPALAGALKDREAAVRCEAIVALVKFGPAAREALPALAEVRQHDRNSRVREYAARALENLQARE